MSSFAILADLNDSDSDCDNDQVATSRRVEGKEKTENDREHDDRDEVGSEFSWADDNESSGAFESDDDFTALEADKTTKKSSANVSKIAGSATTLDDELPELGRLAIAGGLQEGTVGVRRDLWEGPTIRVMCKQTEIRPAVHKNALRAYSDAALAYLTANPAAKEWRLQQGNVAALRDLVDAIDAKDTPFKMPFAKSFMDGLHVYQGAAILGVLKPGIDTSSLRRFLQHRMNNLERLLEYHEVTMIVDFCPKTDPVFKQIAHNLAHKRYKGLIPDPDDFEAYLQEHTNLRDMMQEIDDEKKAARKTGYAQRTLAEGRRLLSLSVPPAPVLHMPLAHYGANSGSQQRNMSRNGNEFGSAYGFGYQAGPPRSGSVYANNFGNAGGFNTNPNMMASPFTNTMGNWRGGSNTKDTGNVKADRPKNKWEVAFEKHMNKKPWISALVRTAGGSRGIVGHGVA